MRRRSFIQKTAAGIGVMALPLSASAVHSTDAAVDETLEADVVIAGGGLGGCAAAMAVLRNGLTVILVEETDWIGGQLTQQGVPPDEHQWIETHGATRLYREFRNRVRDYYRANYPLTDEAMVRPHLNPGDGAVSRLCHEPRVALAVLNGLFAPFVSAGKLTMLLDHKARASKVDGARVRSLTVQDRRSGAKKILVAHYFVDATELGDLLPLTGTEFVTGSESRAITNELHAADKADASNNQAFTMVFAMDYIAGANHVIERPREYDFWKNFVPKMDTRWSGEIAGPEVLKSADTRSLFDRRGD